MKIKSSIITNLNIHIQSDNYCIKQNLEYFNSKTCKFFSNKYEYNMLRNKTSRSIIEAVMHNIGIKGISLKPVYSRRIRKGSIMQDREFELLVSVGEFIQSVKALNERLEDDSNSEISLKYLMTDGTKLGNLVSLKDKHPELDKFVPDQIQWEILIYELLESPVELGEDVSQLDADGLMNILLHYIFLVFNLSGIPITYVDIYEIFTSTTVEEVPVQTPRNEDFSCFHNIHPYYKMLFGFDTFDIMDSVELDSTGESIKLKKSMERIIKDKYKSGDRIKVIVNPNNKPSSYITTHREFNGKVALGYTVFSYDLIRENCKVTTQPTNLASLLDPRTFFKKYEYRLAKYALKQSTTINMYFNPTLVSKDCKIECGDSIKLGAYRYNDDFIKASYTVFNQFMNISKTVCGLVNRKINKRLSLNNIINWAMQVLFLDKIKVIQNNKSIIYQIYFAAYTAQVNMILNDTGSLAISFHNGFVRNFIAQNKGIDLSNYNKNMCLRAFIDDIKVLYKDDEKKMKSIMIPIIKAIILANSSVVSMLTVNKFTKFCIELLCGLFGQTYDSLSKSEKRYLFIDHKDKARATVASSYAWFTDLDALSDIYINDIDNISHLIYNTIVDGSYIVDKYTNYEKSLIKELYNNENEDDEEVSEYSESSDIEELYYEMPMRGK